MVLHMVWMAVLGIYKSYKSLPFYVPPTVVTVQGIGNNINPIYSKTTIKTLSLSLTFSLSLVALSAHPIEQPAAYVWYTTRKKIK